LTFDNEQVEVIKKDYWTRIPEWYVYFTNLKQKRKRETEEEKRSKNVPETIQKQSEKICK